jgi:hypothetical protein
MPTLSSLKLRADVIGPSDLRDVLPHLDDADQHFPVDEERRSTGTGEAKHIKRQSVPVAQLVASQDHVLEANFAGAAKGLAQGKLPYLVLQPSGQFLIVDGHHRIVKQVLEGASTIEAEVYTGPVAKEADQVKTPRTIAASIRITCADFAELNDSVDSTDDEVLPVPFPVIEEGTPWQYRVEGDDVVNVLTGERTPIADMADADLPPGEIPNLGKPLVRKEFEQVVRKLLPSEDIAKLEQIKQQYKDEQKRKQQQKKLLKTQPLVEQDEQDDDEDASAAADALGAGADKGDLYRPTRYVPPASEAVYGETLRLRQNGGVRNILETIRAARPDEVEYWKQWYVFAHEDVQALAEKYDLPYEIVAGVTAALSPNVPWEKNIEAAEHMLRGQGRRIIEYREKLDDAAAENAIAKIYPDLFEEKQTLGTMAYLNNITKAQHLLDNWEEHGTFDERALEEVRLEWGPAPAPAPTKSKSKSKSKKGQLDEDLFGTSDDFLPLETLAPPEPPPPVDGAQPPPKKKKKPTKKKEKPNQVKADPVLARRMIVDSLKRGHEVYFPTSGWSKGEPATLGQIERDGLPAEGRAILVPPISGPKVTTFFKSLTHPEEQMNSVVVDGHAANIWRGRPEALSDLSISKAEYKQMEEDYKRASKLVKERLGLDLAPQQLQAVTWSVWRAAIKNGRKRLNQLRREKAKAESAKKASLTLTAEQRLERL